MQTKDLLHALDLNQAIYKKLHTQTAELDLKIMHLFSNGRNAVQIAMEVPCAEATVYRAKARVEGFLRKELPEYSDNDNDHIYVHNAVGIGMWGLSVRAWKLYISLIKAHQNFEDHVEGKMVHENMPGLRNQAQREAVLAELNEFSVIPNEAPKHNVKVFAFVIYDKAEYRFELTRKALPYYDKFYALQKYLE